MGRSVFFQQTLLDFVQPQANCLASVFSTRRIRILLLTRKINLSYQNETTPQTSTAKKIAIAGLSIGSVGSLVSCSASGGGSGESDNATVGLEPDTPVGESDNVSNSSDVDLDEGLEISDNATVEADSDNSISDAENENNSFNVNLIIDTTDSNYSVLANPGGSLAFNGVNGIPSPGVLVNRTSQDSVDVVSRYCTHLGCVVGNNYVCACHNSRFGKDGSVLQGPASVPIKTYSTTVSSDSILIYFS
jgi:Rieske Fe-S protein